MRPEAGGGHAVELILVRVHVRPLGTVWGCMIFFANKTIVVPVPTISVTTTTIVSWSEGLSSRRVAECFIIFLF